MAENKSSGKKRWPIVVGVVAAVLIVACCGGWAWHNTPSFCGTVCHDSIGNHLANYEGTDESNGAGLAAWHGQHEGTTCLDCHTGSYEELAKQTADLGEYNPHQSPHGNLNCNECHKGHAAQVDTCGQCHSNGGQTMRGNN